MTSLKNSNHPTLPIMKQMRLIKTASLIQILFVFSIVSLASGSELPSDARLLLEKREKAVKAIDQRLVEELEKIKVAHTKRGDLESANAIMELIQSIDGDVESKYLKKLVGTWKRDTDGTFFEFDGRGGGMWNGRDAFTVTYDVEKRQYTVMAKIWTNYLVTGSNPMTLNGIPPNPYNYVLRKTK